jgi:hypothetical protein
MLFFKKILSFAVIIVIAASSPMALASKSCCDFSNEKQTKTPIKMKCHEAAEVSDSSKTKNQNSNEKSPECNCNCGICKVSFFNLPKIIKTSEKYSQKYHNLNSQVNHKALSYGIFNPPKQS